MSINPLPPRQPSYDYFAVHWNQHVVVVSIEVTPFTSSKYPGLTFFPARIRHYQCCPSVGSTCIEEVKLRTASVLETSYSQVSCNLADPNWFAAGTTSRIAAPLESCQLKAELTLSYLQSSNALQSSQQTDASLANEIISLIESFLQARIDPDRPSKKPLPKARPVRELCWHLPHRREGQSYDEFVDVILQLCDTLRKEELIATVQFLAACIHLVSCHLPAVGVNSIVDQSEQSAKQERQKWRRRASTAIKIVNALIATWGLKAFLLFDLFAATRKWFRKLRDISDERRSDITNRIILKLQANPLNGNVEEKDVFDPEEEMANLLNLPSTVTRHRLLPHLPANLSLELAFNRQTTLQLPRPYDWAIFTAIYTGNVGVVINLLRTREASTTDVDPYGLGLFYYASYYCYKNLGLESSMQMCQALVRLEVPVWFCDEIGNSGWETMIDNALISRAAEQESNTNPHASICLIAGLFGRNSTELWEEYISTRGFSRLHEALLDINQEGGTLSNRLANASQDESLVNIIDQMDSRGRTPLAWAVEYGWEEAVALLLGYGADPHQLRPSMRGKSPLLQLAIAGSNTTHPKSSLVGVIKVLVEAGVDVNAPDHEGWTALHVAASWQHYPAITALSSQREISWRAQTSDGKTAADLSLDTDFYPKMLHLTSS